MAETRAPRLTWWDRFIDAPIGGYAMQAFCVECGNHKMRMPFGDDNPFWDGKQCKRCGGEESRYVVAAEITIRWPFRRGWFDRSGVRVDVAAPAATPRGDADA
jgi:hypothetical protein